MAKIFNVNARSVSILVLGFIILPALVSASAFFGLGNFSQGAVYISTLLTGFFILSEIGIRQSVNRKNITKEPLRVFGVVVGVLLVIFSGLNVFGVSLGGQGFQTIQGVTVVFGLVYAVSEAIRR